MSHLRDRITAAKAWARAHGYDFVQHHSDDASFGGWIYDRDGRNIAGSWEDFATKLEDVGNIYRDAAGYWATQMRVRL